MAEKKIPKRKNALGRGLGALLEDTPTSNIGYIVPKGVQRNNLGETDIEKIEANPFQPRTHFEKETLNELSESIIIHGIIQPITVRKLGGDRYQLISGERRLQASKLAGLTKIPTYIRTANDQQMLEMALIENIQRENLNAIEIAISYQRLISDCQLKQEQLGERVGKKRTTVNNYLRLLKLPPDIQIAVRDNDISMGHARALVNIENVDTQLTLLKKILQNDLSVRKVEALVRALSDQTPKEQPQTKSPGTNPEVIKLQKNLSSHFGSKVAVKSEDGKKGEIRIPFVSVEDLNRILEILEV